LRQVFEVHSGFGLFHSFCWKGGALVSLLRVRNDMEQAVSGSFDLEIEAPSRVNTALPDVPGRVVLLDP